MAAAAFGAGAVVFLSCVQVLAWLLVFWLSWRAYVLGVALLQSDVDGGRDLYVAAAIVMAAGLISMAILAG